LAAAKRAGGAVRGDDSLLALSGHRTSSRRNRDERRTVSKPDYIAGGERGDNIFDVENPFRRTSFRHPTVAGCVLLVFIAQAGCVPKPAIRPDPEPDPLEFAGVVTADFLPEVVLDLPAKGRVDGAVRGAGQGFISWAKVPLRILAEGMRGCNSMECGYLAVGLLALATATGTVGAVVGGVGGAMRAIPAEEARAIEAAPRMMATLKIQETMRSRILDAAWDAAGCEIVPLPGVVLPAVDCVVDYTGFTKKGVGSVIEVGVVSIGFKGERWGSRPPLSVFLKVRVRRYRADDGRMLEEKELAYRSEERSFESWMADGATRMEEEFRKGYENLAADIVAGVGCATGGGSVLE
jgi:hypothetical protein